MSRINPSVIGSPPPTREASRLRIQRAISELGLANQAAQYAPDLALGESPALTITSDSPLLGIASGGRLIA